MQFLRGDFRGSEKPLRPPWAVDESQFVKLCDSCGDCIQACPTSILIKGRAGLPIVDFSRGECEFCDECVSICKTGALKRTREPREVPWTLKAIINGKCITRQGVVCRSCGEQCEYRAIRFSLVAGRVPQPELDKATCNGCGACVSICPVAAISIASQS